MTRIRRGFFLLCFLLCFSGHLSPPVALISGIFFGLLLVNPFPEESRMGARLLLQLSVIALGFGMNLHEVVRAGRSGFLYTALGIIFALSIGLALGRALKIRGNSSYLISAGTAICGGSAIAAIGPILQATPNPLFSLVGWD